MNRIAALLLVVSTLLAAIALARPTYGNFVTTRPTTSVATTQPAPADGQFEDDAPPFMFIFAVIALLVLLFVAAAGLVIGAAIVAVVAMLILLGIVSTSVLVTVKSRRFESGAKVLLIQLAAVGGAITGAAAFWVAAWWCDLNASAFAFLAGGAAAGLAAGAIVGLLLNAIWVRVRFWILSRRPGKAFVVSPAPSNPPPKDEQRPFC